MINGRILQVASDRFWVDTEEGVLSVKSRKKLKRETSLLPGDIAMLNRVDGELVLSGIRPRINSLIRPPIANIDRIIVTVAPVPQVDFITVDKMLIQAHKAGISTVVCVNKTDMPSDDLVRAVQMQYDGVADEVITASAADNRISALEQMLRGKFTCFAGQSAVGKTSLINAVCGLSRQVGGLSEKTLRGKNTTTGVELIKIGEDSYVADTPGFGALDLMDIQPEELMLYYDEYVALAGKCRYHMCTHVNEPACAVREAVESGLLNEERYKRYLAIYEELKIKKSHRKSWRNANEYK